MRICICALRETDAKIHLDHGRDEQVLGETENGQAVDVSAIDAITKYTKYTSTQYTPCSCSKKRSRAQKAKDTLLAYPGSATPDSLKTLYVIVWKYN